MLITNEGKTQFQTFGELYYNFFSAMDIGISPDGYLFDNETRTVLKYKDKNIKASVNDQPVYGGKTDIVFEPHRTYHLITTLFGYYMDKIERNPETQIGFVSQGTEDNKEVDIHRMFVDCNKYGRIQSEWYHDVYLAYFDIVFKIDGLIVDLSNLDNRIIVG